MARPKIKDTAPMSFRIDKALSERLTAFCNDSGQSKTTAVERAIIAYIDDYNKKMAIIDNVEKKA